MSYKKKDEPLWMQMYREEIIKPKLKERYTEQQGRTEASRAGFYQTKAWHKIRDKRRRNNPLCQRCEPKGWFNPGKVVNHKKPVEDYPELALDYNNTEHLCNKCNDWQTKEDARQRKKLMQLKRGKKLMKDLETPAPPGGWVQR